MGWFKKEEEDFDDSAAYEGDKYATLKVILMIIFGTAVVILVIWMGYNQFQKMSANNNDTNQSNLNITKNGDKIPPGKVVVNFTDFNLTVTENPSGIYYYSTQEKVVGEECYINGIKKNCNSLTNSVCSEKECTKDLITETECFVNSEKVKCQE